MGGGLRSRAIPRGSCSNLDPLVIGANNPEVARPRFIYAGHVALQRLAIALRRRTLDRQEFPSSEPVEDQIDQQRVHTTASSIFR